MAEKQLVPMISKVVDIDGEKFSLEFVPKTSTQLVQNEKVGLTSNLDLLGLVDDLRKLSSFVRLAYYGVAGSTDLQIKVQKVGFTVAELCQESDVTVVLFKKACGEIVDTLQSTYEYLMDGIDVFAIENLKGLSEVARRMETASKDLMKEFEKAKELVKETVVETMAEKGNQEKQKKDMQKRHEETELEAAKEREKKKVAQEVEDEKQKAYFDAKRKEYVAESKLDKAVKVKSTVKHNIFRVFERGVKFIIRDDTKCSVDYEIENEKRRAAQAREERLVTLQEAEAQRAAQLDATLKLIECVSRIQLAEKCTTEEGVCDSAIAALHGAQGALMAIVAVMMKATKFWKMMKEYCDQMADDKILKKVERAMQQPPEMRLKFWSSPPFIKEGVTYYAKWVALEDICTTIRDQIRVAEKQMFLYMEENPTTEEARTKVPALAAALEEDLQNAIKDMEKKSKDDKKEIAETTKQTEDDKSLQVEEEEIDAE